MIQNPLQTPYKKQLSANGRKSKKKPEPKFLDHNQSPFEAGPDRGRSDCEVFLLRNESAVLSKEIALSLSAQEGLRKILLHASMLKNLSQIMTLVKLMKERASHESIFQQALHTVEIVKTPGLHRKVIIKQAFLNCITKEAAAAMSGIGIEVLGCIQ